MRLNVLNIFVAGFVLTGCSTTPRPTGVISAEVKDGPFAEGPYIVKRADLYYLRYRAALEDGHLSLLRDVLALKTRDKAYYFFSVPISHPEWGNLKERPLAYDGFAEFARQDAVYWLNPEGSEVKLKII